MRLTAMRLRSFRNLGAQEVAVPPEGVAIVGGNAQGKTNFLEAIYYLETLRSFRGAPDEDLVAFGAGAFRIVAALEGEGASTEVAAAYQREGRRKKAFLDGVEADRLGDALGRLGAVVFSPADVSIVSGGPGERRRFLDVVLSLNVAGYLPSLQRFRQVLARRNACLRDESPRALVEAWDGSLTDSGARVLWARHGWVQAQGEAFAERHARVAGGQPGSLVYESSVPLGGVRSVDEAAEAYLHALRAAAARERRAGVTVVGPHRDELSLRAWEGEEWVDVRRFGSGGQRRTAALALRLVEARTIRAARGRDPVVLLDDVFAELDEARSERVLELIETEETAQVILTAPRESDVKVRRDSLPRWCIREGRLST